MVDLEIQRTCANHPFRHLAGVFICRPLRFSDALNSNCTTTVSLRAIASESLDNIHRNKLEIKVEYHRERPRALVLTLDVLFRVPKKEGAQGLWGLQPVGTTSRSESSPRCRPRVVPLLPSSFSQGDSTAISRLAGALVMFPILLAYSYLAIRKECDAQWQYTSPNCQSNDLRITQGANGATEREQTGRPDARSPSRTAARRLRSGRGGPGAGGASSGRTTCDNGSRMIYRN